MSQRIVVLIFAVVMWPLLSSELMADGLIRGRRLVTRGTMYAATKGVQPSRPPTRRYPTAAELYPKYYGSFHYRHLDNIGVPTGDIGLRGNGLYWSPW